MTIPTDADHSRDPRSSEQTAVTGQDDVSQDSGSVPSSPDALAAPIGVTGDAGAENAAFQTDVTNPPRAEPVDGVARVHDGSPVPSHWSAWENPWRTLVARWNARKKISTLRTEGGTLQSVGRAARNRAAGDTGDAPSEATASPGRWTSRFPLGEALGAPALNRDFVQTLVVLLPAVILAIMGYDRRWVSDDGFIDLRIVRHLVDGHGPLYNVDERVETYTNPLWVAFLALWGRLGGTLETGAIVLGLALTVVGVLAAQAAAMRLARRELGSSRLTEPGLTLPLGALVFASVPPAWDFVTSGLETGLGFGWLGLSYWLLVRCLAPEANARNDGSGPHRARFRWWIAAATTMGLGPLIRPDMGVFSVAFLAALLVGDASQAGRGWALTRGSGRRVLKGSLGAVQLLAVAALLPGAYQVFRMGYYAGIVPNTALAKEAGLTNWTQGWRYASDFLGTYALAVPLLVLLGWWGVRFDRVWVRRDWIGVTLLLAPVAGGVVQALFVIRVGGDFMHARMLLPSLFAVLLPMASVVIRPGEFRVGYRPRLRTAAVAALVAWAFLCAFSMRAPYGNVVSPEGIADERAVYVSWSGLPNPVRVEDYQRTTMYQEGLLLREQTEAVVDPSNRVLIFDEVPQEIPGYTGPVIPLDPTVPHEIEVVGSTQLAGIIAYAAGPRVHVVDRFGLADPIGSRLRLGPNRTRPGHEKILTNEWLVGRFANLVPNASPAVRASHEALRCGELDELVRAVREPLTVRRFLDNFRKAWSFYYLRIPGDPLEARAEICGGEGSGVASVAEPGPATGRTTRWAQTRTAAYDVRLLICRANDNRRRNKQPVSDHDNIRAILEQIPRVRPHASLRMDRLDQFPVLAERSEAAMPASMVLRHRVWRAP